MLALGCGVIAAIGITQVMAKRGAEPAQPELETILVAISDIPMGDPISPQMVKPEEWPKDKVPKGALRTLEEIENRRPKSRIFTGWPIQDNQLLGKGVLDQGASDSIPKGMRVIAVKVDLVSGSASLIRPGDRVDVLVHLRQGSADQTRTMAKTILQDIKVFAVDDVWEASTPSKEKAVVAKTISLLVSPAQAEKITLATEMGNLRLVMRSPTDKEQVKNSGADATDVLGGEVGVTDRTVPSLVPPPSAKAKPNAVAGLLGMLNTHKSKKASSSDPTPTPPQAAKPEVFTIRVVAGSQVTDTVLQSTSDSKSPSIPDASFLNWKVNSSPPLDRPVVKPADTPPPEPPVPDDDPANGAGTSNKKKSLDD
jgi:pilus assembly protein CpaB